MNLVPQIRKCTWKPTPGKLYQNCWAQGFYFNDKPIMPQRYRRINGAEIAGELISYHDVFLFVGGPGSRQTVPEHFTAFKVLWQDRLGWLIYPHVYSQYIGAPIDPIRL